MVFLNVAILSITGFKKMKELTQNWDNNRLRYTACSPELLVVFLPLLIR